MGRVKCEWVYMNYYKCKFSLPFFLVSITDNQPHGGGKLTETPNILINSSAFVVVVLTPRFTALFINFLEAPLRGSSLQQLPGAKTKAKAQ